MKKRLFLVSLLFLWLASCGSGGYTLSSISEKSIPVVQTTAPDGGLSAFIESHKSQVDRAMNQIIGRSGLYMETGRPESLLTNFTSDAMMQLGVVYPVTEKIDLALMNVHGHRSSLPQGEITVGNLYKIYSFDNRLVIVRLRGRYLKQLFEAYAQMGGAGVSGNVKIKSQNKTVLTATIDDEPLDEARLYTLVTLDYLAEGNDGMQAMTHAELVEDTGVLLRDYMLGRVKEQTKRGEVLTSRLDGRIIVME